MIADTEVIRPSHSGREENLEGLDMDKDKKSLVSREIKSFRDSYRVNISYETSAVEEK